MARILAMFVNFPAVACEITIVSVALAPLEREPKLQVKTSPSRVKLPWELVAEMKFIEGGNVLLKMTLLAFVGPLFWTVIV